MPIEPKQITLPNGVRLEYAVQGDHSGVPVLFLHGYADSRRSFETVLPHLPESFYALTLTQRGHGDSDRPETGYTMRDFAADAAAFCEALELGPAVIVGHSMGSFVAIRFALDYPGHTRGLVLIGTGTTVQGNPGVEELAQVVNSMTGAVDPEFVQEFQEGVIAQPIPPERLKMLVAESQKVPLRVWQAAINGIQQVDFTAELPRIKVPTLIAWGDQETLFPRSEQDAFLAAVPSARLIVYPGAGHCPNWEQSKKFAADLTAFVETLD